MALFLELFAIRWLSSDIRAFTVFKTFPLVACFVGFGLGYARVNDKLLVRIPIALLIFCLLINLADSVGFCLWGFPSASVFQWQPLVMVGSSLQYLSIFIVCLLALLVGPLLLCMYLGTRIASLFEQSAPLSAYAVNLLGAVAGSILFTVVSFLGPSPPWLLTIPALAILISLLKRKQWIGVGVLFAAVFVSFIPEHTTSLPLEADIADKIESTHSVLWSPYQRIDVTAFRLRNTDKNRVVGVELGVNRAFYQYYLDDSIDASILPQAMASMIEARRVEYKFPFELRKDAKSVLVVGAGTGQHVATALKMGATDIDAVEIDPLIIRMGDEYNAAYASPLVHKICDDARHYFNVCKKKYDLIIFSVLDSHTVAGQGSSVRLDSYVYTQQSFQKAASLLNPTGVLYISYASFRPQIESRLYETLKAAYNGAVCCYKSDFLGKNQNSYFAIGAQLKTTTPPAGWRMVAPPTAFVARPVLTDDWPYLYIDPTIVDGPYLLVVGIIVAISAFLARQTIFQDKQSGLNWQLFFLGSAFLLLELASIARLSLLFGSTWLTSAIVINLVLGMLLVANLIAIRFGSRLNDKVLYAALFTLILVSWLIPTNQMSAIAGSIGVAGPYLIAIATLSPMIAAGLIFPKAFAKAPSPAKALTFNILGSVLGGLLEYLSYYFGNSGLILISGILYLVSFLCYLRIGKTTAISE